MDIGEWLRRMFPSPLLSKAAVDVTEPAAQASGPVWCVVANVVYERRYGPGGSEVRQGTKHFAGGAKVYVFEFFWGMGGEQVRVVGRHRKSKRYITLVMRANHLANWRAELVYSPHVIRQVLTNGEFAGLLRAGLESKTRAEEIAARYIKGGAASQPFNIRSSGAPKTLRNPPESPESPESPELS